MAGVLWHNTWLAVALTVGMGLMVIVKNKGEPEQVLPELVNDGNTVTVPVCGVAPVLVPVNELMFPDPLAARPMEVFELVQL